LRWVTVLPMIEVGFSGANGLLAAALALPALLLLGGSGAAARKGRSRVRHFAMPFASTVVNAANADHASRCVCVAPHGCVLCTWLGGIHCVPRRGATALLGMQHGTSAHGSGSNGCSGVGAAGDGLWSSIRLWLCAISLRHLARSRTRSRPPPSVSQRVHVCIACIMGLLRVHISAVQRWSHLL